MDTRAKEKTKSTIIDLSEIQKEQTLCRITSHLLSWKQTGTIPIDKVAQQTILAVGRNLVIIEGVLCQIALSDTTTKQVLRVQIVIPASLQSVALQAAHNALIEGGYFEVDKTYCKITERWWWPGVYLDTRHYVISYDTCGCMRRTNYPKQALLESITVSETFEVVGMDICGPFPVTS